MRGRLLSGKIVGLNFLRLFEGLKLRRRNFVPTAEGNKEDFIGILLYLQAMPLCDVQSSNVDVCRWLGIIIAGREQFRGKKLPSVPRRSKIRVRTVR